MLSNSTGEMGGEEGKVLVSGERRRTLYSGRTIADFFEGLCFQLFIFYVER